MVTGLDLISLSSRVEGFPNAIVEAMAAGVPYAGVQVGAIPEMIGGTGWMVPPSDALSIVGSVGKGARDSRSTPLLAKGLLARARVLANYSIDNTVQQYARAYAEMADEAFDLK